MGQGLNCSSGILQDRRDSGCSTLNQSLGQDFGFLDINPQKYSNQNQKLQKIIFF